MDFAKLLAAHAQESTSSRSGKSSGGKRSREDGSEGGGGGRSHKRERRDYGRQRDSTAAEKEKVTRTWRHAWEPRRLKRVSGRYLVVIPAGDASLHDDAEWPWHPAASRGDFDLCVIYYGKNSETRDKYKRHSKFFFEKQGPKWQLVRLALKKISWKDKYEYIWLPDDDLRIEPSLIKNMFSIASEHGILLGQPALFDVNVQRQYRDILVRREGLKLHYSNFVEIMAPFMRCDALSYLFLTIDADQCKSGWGLDSVWPSMLNFANIAVIDATPVLHTRPQNAFSVENSFYKMYNIDPQREYHDIMRWFRVRDFKKRRFAVEIQLVDSATPHKADVKEQQVVTKEMATPKQTGQAKTDARPVDKKSSNSRSPTGENEPSSVPQSQSPSK